MSYYTTKCDVQIENLKIIILGVVYASPYKVHDERKKGSKEENKLIFYTVPSKNQVLCTYVRRLNHF